MLFIALLLVTTFNVFAGFGELKGCGDYQISGTIIKDAEKVLKIVVHEGTKSEHQIFVDSNDLASISGYVNRDVIFDGTIDSVDGTKLHAINLSDFKNRVPNPLDMKGSTGFKLIKNKECIK